MSNQIQAQLLQIDQPPIFLVDFKKENDKIKEECFKIFDSSDKVSANNQLAGNLEHEYNASERISTFFLSSFSSLLEQVIRNTSDNESEELDWSMSHCWINFQKKYEFNPMHHHDGFYSFVYWAQIPYDIEEEYKQNHSKNSKYPCPSNFSFAYSNMLGKICDYPVPLSKTNEGNAMLFPSKMKHMVYPFYTSDDYRVSISGNIHVKIKSSGRIPDIF